MKIKIAFTIVFFALLAGRASAIGFTFLQAGFAEGATVTGAFFGEDLNDDGLLAGQLGDPSSEVAFFSAFWSGNSSAPAFTISSSDPDVSTWSIVYELGASGGLLGDNPLEFTFNLGLGGGYLASSIGGGIYTGGSDPSAFTGELAVVSPIDDDPARVPDSGSAMMLFSLGLMALLYAKRRQI